MMITVIVEPDSYLQLWYHGKFDGMKPKNSSSAFLVCCSRVHFFERSHSQLAAVHDVTMRHHPE